MPEKILNYPYQLKEIRKQPDRDELRLLMQQSVHEGGSKTMPDEAKRFAGRFSANVAHYPVIGELPNWFRALIQKKVSVEELTKTLHDMLYRAPVKENQELGLLIANEIARMKGGPEVLSKYMTSDLLSKLSGKGGELK